MIFIAGARQFGEGLAQRHTGIEQHLQRTVGDDDMDAEIAAVTLRYAVELRQLQRFVQQRRV